MFLPILKEMENLSIAVSFFYKSTLTLKFKLDEVL